MTKKSIHEKGTEFSEWLRDQPEIDSKLGYVTTNIDYVWKNYKTGKWCFIEEKRYMAKVGYSQKEIYRTVVDSCKTSENFRGVHLIQFENRSPDDGKIWLDGIEITKQELTNWLQDIVA